MISRLLSTTSRSLLAAGLLASTLGAAAPVFAASGQDLNVSIAASDSSIPLGDTVDLTFTMTNIGTIAVSSARLEGSIIGAAAVSIVQQPTGQQNQCTLNATSLTCDGMVLGANDAAVVKVRASASNTATGTIAASATADPQNTVGESNEANNSANRNVTVFRLPDLKATILDGPDVVKGGADVTFKVKVQNLGGSADHIDLDFRTTSGLVYKSVDFVDSVAHGFSCDLHNPAFGVNYVSCSGGSLGDPNVSPSNDESVTLTIGATVKSRGLTSKDRTVTFTVDPDHSITESKETNNIATFDYYYD